MSESEPLQFDRAEDDAPAGHGLSCALCKIALVDQYFTVTTKPVCAACKQLCVDGFYKKYSGSFGKALLFGSGAALLGAALYYGVVAITGYQLGLIAVLVGYLVGKGVSNGAGRRGGLGYQALAVGLTYVSIALSYVPALLKSQNAGSSVDWLSLVGPTLITPIYMSFQAPLTAVINGFAIWEAWKLNRKLQLPITGPHQVNGAPPVVASAAPPPHVG